MSKAQTRGATMKWLKRLDNPFLLVIEGFLAGAFLFAATHPELIESRPQPAPTAQPAQVR